MFISTFVSAIETSLFRFRVVGIPQSVVLHLLQNNGENLRKKCGGEYFMYLR